MNIDPNFLEKSMRNAFEQLLFVNQGIILLLVIAGIVLLRFDKRYALMMFFAAAIATMTGLPWAFIMGLFP